jgi:hypothetical protein
MGLVCINNNMRPSTYTKEETINKLDAAIQKYKCISEFAKNEKDVYYYMRKYNLQNKYKNKFITQRFSTQQIICKIILEHLLQEKCIYNTRKQLINEKELDIFFEKYKLACEYNSFYWHNLPNVKEQDQIKQKLCKEKNIYLITITEPYLGAHNNLHNAINDIKKQFIKQISYLNKIAKKEFTKDNINKILITYNDLFTQAFNQKDIQEAINTCQKYSEFRKKYNRMYQFLQKKKMLHLLDSLKQKDYTHMNNKQFIEYVTKQFSTYTEFSQHKIYQVARLRKLLPLIKLSF